MAARSRIVVLTTLCRAARVAMRPGGPGLPTRLASIPRLLRSTLTGRYAGLTAGRLALMAAALVYIVSPLDLIPEGALLMLGTLDDAMVLAWLAAALVTETEDFLAWEDGGVGTADGVVVATEGTIVSATVPFATVPFATSPVATPVPSSAGSDWLSGVPRR